MEGFSKTLSCRVRQMAKMSIVSLDVVANVSTTGLSSEQLRVSQVWWTNTRIWATVSIWSLNTRKNAVHRTILWSWVVQICGFILRSIKLTSFSKLCTVLQLAWYHTTQTIGSYYHATSGHWKTNGQRQRMVCMEFLLVFVFSWFLDRGQYWQAGPPSPS